MNKGSIGASAEDARSALPNEALAAENARRSKAWQTLLSRLLSDWLGG
ncbi:MAG: hypothetical protein ACI9VI_000817 [Candidatus Azotimanducaceae bacterium]|jgi:hypothetical protein